MHIVSIVFILSVNDNGYVPLLIDTFDTMVRAGILLTVSDGGGYSVEVAWHGCWGEPAVTSRCRTSLNLRRPSPPGSNPPWRGCLSPEVPFFVEFGRGPRRYWSCRTCLSYGSVPGPTLIRTLSYARQFDGAHKQRNFLTVSDGYSVEVTWRGCWGSPAFASRGRLFLSLLGPSPRL